MITLLLIISALFIIGKLLTELKENISNKQELARIEREKTIAAYQLRQLKRKRDNLLFINNPVNANPPIIDPKQLEKENKARQKEIDNQCKLDIARSDLESIENEIVEIRMLTELAEQEREKCIPGSKEYKKFTKEYIACVKKWKALDNKWTKAKAIIDKLS